MPDIDWKARALAAENVVRLVVQCDSNATVWGGPAFIEMFRAARAHLDSIQSSPQSGTCDGCGHSMGLHRPVGCLAGSIGPNRTCLCTGDGRRSAPESPPHRCGECVGYVNRLDENSDEKGRLHEDWDTHLASVYHPPRTGSGPHQDPTIHSGASPSGSPEDLTDQRSDGLESVRHSSRHATDDAGSPPPMWAPKPDTFPAPYACGHCGWVSEPKTEADWKDTDEYHACKARLFAAMDEDEDHDPAEGTSYDPGVLHAEQMENEDSDPNWTEESERGNDHAWGDWMGDDRE